MAGQPSGALPPPHPHSASPMKELLSVLTWQLPAVQELHRHLSTPYPPHSVLTLDYIHSLKVVGNEKEGGWGKWQMIDIGLGLW